MFSDEKTSDKPVKATFDSHYDSDSAWDFASTSRRVFDCLYLILYVPLQDGLSCHNLNLVLFQDVDQESSHGNMSSDSSNSWGLNPIRTNKNTITFDSVPSTPAYSNAGSPSGSNLFHNHGPFASSFVDSVPSTPAYSNTQRPFTSVFADSVPSTPMFDGPEDHSFNNLSRFDSFASNTPRDPFSRFDSFRSTAQDSESESNQGFFPSQNLARFDSMHSTADSDFGHSLFQTRESFSRFDSMRNSNDSSDINHGFPSFDDADTSGSHRPFKTSFESETPRRNSVDGWKAF